MVIRVVVCGVTGRMGQALSKAIGAADDLTLTGGIAESDAQRPAGMEALDIVSADNAGQLIAGADAVIDFSAPAALTAMIRGAGASLDGKALIVGTTGLDSAANAALEEAAKRAAVVVAANFSVGVNLLLDLVQRAAAVLDDRFDIEIVEAHHRQKVDAPSGTALALARSAAAGREVDLAEVRIDGRSGTTGVRPAGQIAMHAMRGGAVVGEHRVHFLGDAERIELAHIATDRALFAEGALTAARWATGHAPGAYTMRDVLGL